MYESGPKIFFQEGYYAGCTVSNNISFSIFKCSDYKKRRNTMPPFPQDSDDDPEEMFVSNDDDGDLQYDEGDMENAIILDDNDAPGEEAKFLLILL